MIEIRENPDSLDRSEYLLFIDGVLLKNAPVSLGADGYWITTKDIEAYLKVANHSLSEFPPRTRYMRFRSIPDGIRYLHAGMSILHEMEKSDETGEYEDTDEYSVNLELGNSALSQWRSPYGFADYACEMYRILETSNMITGVNLLNVDNDILDRIAEEDEEGNRHHIKIDLAQVDRARIFGLDVTFRYSSPEGRIEDELKRISEVIEEAHIRVERLLTPPTSNLIEIKKTDDSETGQLFVNGSLLSE